MTYLLSEMLFPKTTYKPQFGDIIPLPSSTPYGTLLFTSEAERCVVAFGLVPTSTD